MSSVSVFILDGEEKEGKLLNEAEESERERERRKKSERKGNGNIFRFETTLKL